MEGHLGYRDSARAIRLTRMLENFQILEERLLEEEIERITAHAKVEMEAKLELQSEGQ